MTSTPIPLDLITGYVEEHIITFHESRLAKLRGLNLNTVLRRKNPYLFRAKNIMTAESFVRNVLDAFLSSQEETLFGLFLEEMAVFVGRYVHNGYKPDPSTLEGIDLVFADEKKLYVVEIKSGPFWGNSSQIQKMIQNFARARDELLPLYPKHEFIAVNGCCYGREANPVQKKGKYLKLCGQDFWRFISSDDEFYTAIVQPIGHQAKQRNEQFMEAYAQIINLMTLEFAQTYCHRDGSIDWERLVQFTSQRPVTASYPLNEK
jgi:hypothetical protein